MGDKNKQYEVMFNEAEEKERLCYRDQRLVRLQSKNQFTRKQTADVKFRDVSFCVRKFIWKKPFFVEKQILHGVNGEFRSGELTAIMGPSGAGKSTLLNILAAHTLSGMTGKVFVNGKQRNDNRPEVFKRLSCYIQQEDFLRYELTVEEAMITAAQLKLGSKVSRKQKNVAINDILDMLGLSNCVNTRIGSLSGGQKKRLSIAFELLNNPPIIFLDEPTTGLDSSACSQCISLLKLLAQQGRTVICTIHQPSALIFEMFDHLYALSSGSCIYEGPTNQLIPYLSERGLVCPMYHNPADFLLEVAIGEYGPVAQELSAVISKNHGVKIIEITTPPLLLEVKDGVETHRSSKVYLNTIEEIPSKTNIWSRVKFPTEFIAQFYYLYVRNMITFQKEFRRRLTIFMAHILSSVLVGLLFYNAGNQATMVRSNMCFIFGVLIFLVYVGKMMVMLTIPNEIEILKAEHFNRWYSLPPYYLSLIITEIPFQMFNAVTAVFVCYYLSDQPMELFRFLYFTLFCVCTTLAAQAIGFFVGATVPIKIGVFIGPVSACVLAVFGFSVRFCDTSLFFQWLALLSYFRSAFASISTVFYGYNRGQLECGEEEMYCHFKSPQKVLEDLDLAHINIYSNLIYICTVGVAMHVLTFITLYIKLNKR